MTISTDSPGLPSLFAHALRKDWGVGILAGEADGKLRYLFENGEERTLASGFQEMMHRVEKPSSEQRAAYARLRGVLAARTPGREGSKSSGANFLEQLDRFHRTYPGGLSDPKWLATVRGEGAERRAPQHRQAMVREAQEQLSLKALDALLGNQQFGQVWDQVLTVLRHTDLVPAAQFKQRVPSDEQRRALAVAVREMLHGSGAYDPRFGRFLAAFSAAFGAPPRWELATALSAVVHPADHVCVEPTAFRKQLKASGSRRAVGAQPSSAAYTSILGIARLIGNKLAEQGELPQDLFDARDFIVFTQKPMPKARSQRESTIPTPETTSEDDE